MRLTAEDGYQAQRSYSIASAPDGSRVELTVQRLDDGEVSPYTVLYGDELRRLAERDSQLNLELVYTRRAPAGWEGPVGRLDAAQLATLAWPPVAAPACFVCGPTGFVEATCPGCVSAVEDEEDIVVVVVDLALSQGRRPRPASPRLVCVSVR